MTINFNDFYQMQRKAREQMWETKEMKWHVWEPAARKCFEDIANTTSLFTDSPSQRPLRDEILGIKAIVYPEHAKSEIFGLEVVLENTKTWDAFTIKDGKIILLKRWWMPAGVMG